MTAENKLYNPTIPSLSSEISPTSAEIDLDSCWAKPKSSTARSQKSSHCGWGGLDCFHWSCNLLLTEQRRSWQISLTSPIALLQNVTDLSSTLGILSLLVSLLSLPLSWTDSFAVCKILIIRGSVFPSPIQLNSMVHTRNTEAFPHFIFMFQQAGTEGLKSPAVLTWCNSKFKSILITAKVCVHENIIRTHQDQ